jgi:hypothetical protein
MVRASVARGRAQNNIMFLIRPVDSDKGGDWFLLGTLGFDMVITRVTELAPPPVPDKSF